jgi:hypothetical protein
VPLAVSFWKGPLKWLGNLAILGGLAVAAVHYVRFGPKTDPEDSTSSAGREGPRRTPHEGTRP